MLNESSNIIIKILAYPAQKHHSLRPRQPTCMFWVKNQYNSYVEWYLCATYSFTAYQELRDWHDEAIRHDGTGASTLVHSTMYDSWTPNIWKSALFGQSFLSLITHHRTLLTWIGVGYVQPAIILVSEPNGNGKW